MTRMMPSDPRFEAVQNLLALLNVAVNPACDFYAAAESRSAEWKADIGATRTNILAELAQILGCTRDE